VERRKVGRSGLTVSELGLGTMTWGRATDADEAAETLVCFHDAGGTLIDTAASYGFGQAETILGSLLDDVVPREELVISTKAGIRTTPDGRFVDTSRGALLRSLDSSLTKLGVDYVDLWQVHTVDPSVPPEETLSALDSAVASGRTRYAGVSNYPGWRLAHAVTHQQAATGRAPIVANQVEYSLLERGIEREVVPACTHFGVGLLPYSPLGGGVLTGKYRGGVPSDSRAARQGSLVGDRADQRAGGIVQAVATAADGLAVAPLAVALSWLRDRPAVSSVLVGPRTVAQLSAALAALTLTLPDAIRSALDDVSAPPTGYPENAH
jgi:aryl-alcohol dehydrogenase-like predicted oxidoreductase